MTKSTRNQLVRRPRLYVHIGLHKTGTTSVQVAFQHAHVRLKAQGILYPISICPTITDVGHHYLAWAALERPELVPPRIPVDDGFRETIFNALDQEISASAAHTVILSSEEFCVLNLPEIAAFCARFRAFDIVPMLAVRNSSDVTESSYKTAVVHADFPWDIKTYIDNYYPRLDVYGIVKDWLAQPNCLDAIILDYDDPSQRADMVQTIFSALGLNISLVSHQGRLPQNLSINAIICELARTLRNFGCGNEHIQPFIAKMGEARFIRDPGFDYGFLTDNMRARLHEQYNNQLAYILDDPQTRRCLHGTRLPRPLSLPARTVARPFYVIENDGDALMLLAHVLRPEYMTT